MALGRFYIGQSRLFVDLGLGAGMDDQGATGSSGLTGDGLMSLERREMLIFWLRHASVSTTSTCHILQLAAWTTHRSTNP